MSMLKGRGIFEVILMSIKWLSVVVFILLIGCQQAIVSADKQTGNTNQVNSGADSDRQLQINKNTKSVSR